MTAENYDTFFLLHDFLKVHIRIISSAIFLAKIYLVNEVLLDGLLVKR